MARDRLLDVLTDEERQNTTKAEGAALRSLLKTQERLTARIHTLDAELADASTEYAETLETIRARLPQPEELDPVAGDEAE